MYIHIYILVYVPTSFSLSLLSISLCLSFSLHLCPCLGPSPSASLLTYLQTIPYIAIPLSADQLIYPPQNQKEAHKGAVYTEDTSLLRVASPLPCLFGGVSLAPGKVGRRCVIIRSYNL